jgi:class 3 adenylate cyclase
MINIIAEERTKTKNPALKSLDMRIGIHTGKIVGGIIGTKVVRYDIFGQDVLIANKMESNGVAGAVCISEQTYKLIQKNQFVSNTLDFTEHNTCEIGTIGKTIKTFIVKQIFNDAGSS